jgi:hypothetical protein
MSVYRELQDALPFDPTEREGIWGYRGADEPKLVRLSVAAGAILALCLATGGGVAPRIDWGAALFFGLATAVFTRGLLLAGHKLANGGWQAWRRRTTNEPAIDLLSAIGGVALALFLVTGGSGIGPAFAPAQAALAGLLAGLALRLLLTFARWP